MTNKKHILLVLGLVILLFSLTAISAAQQDGNQTITKTADHTSTKTAQPTVTKTAEPTKQVETKTPEKNITKKTQEKTKKELTQMEVTPESYDSIVDNYGTLFAGDTEYIFKGNFEEDALYITGSSNNVIINGKNATFSNWFFQLEEGASNITFDSMNIQSNDYDTSIFHITNSNNISIINSSLTIENTGNGDTRAIELENVDNAIIKDNVLIAKGKPQYIDFTTGSGSGYSHLQAILAKSTTNSTISDNVVLVDKYDGFPSEDMYDSQSFSSSDAITVIGYKDTPSKGNLVKSNKVTISGARFLYGINALNNLQDCTIRDNEVSIIGARYLDGIQVGNNAHDIYIINNTILGVCQNDTPFTGQEDESISYGIIMTSNGGANTTNFLIKDNYININSTYVYGMEIYVAQHGNITNNTIELEGVYTTGMGLGYGHHNNITHNTITVHGNTNQEVHSVVEHITPTVSGIKTQHFSNNLLISDNVIETSDIGGNDQTIHIDSNNTVIIGNQLTSSQGEGVESVKVVNGKNITCDGRDISKVYQTELIGLSDKNVPAGENLTITGMLINKERETTIGNANIKIKIKHNDELVTETTSLTDQDGLFKFIYPSESITYSSYTVDVIYEGSEDYYPTNKSIAVTAEVLTPTSIQLEYNTTIARNENITVEATLLASENPVTGEIINATLLKGEETVDSQLLETDNQGKIVYTYTADSLDEGEYKVIFNFNKTEQYAASTATATITVNLLRSTNINTSSEINITRKDDLVITGKLVDEDKNAVNGATIVVSVTSGNEAVALGNATTGEDGSFTYTLGKDNLTAEEYDVTLNYEGQGNYLSSSATVKVNVNQSIATSILTDSVMNISRKDDLVIAGVVFDEDDNAVGNVDVLVIVQSGNEAVASETVKTTGSGTFGYTLGKGNLTNDEYNVIIKFEGADNLLPSTAEVEVNVNQTRATSILTDSVMNISRKDDLVIAGVVFDEDDNAVGNVDVLVIVQSGNEAVASETVKTTGSGTFSYTLGKGNLTNDEYNVIIKFEGADNLLPSTAEVQVNVNQTRATTIVTDETINIEYDEDLVITGKLQDEDQTAMALETIRVKITGENEVIYDNVTTTDNGEFTYTLPKENLKYETYVVYLDYEGKDLYQASNKTINVNVDFNKQSFYKFEFDPISDVFIGNEATITGTLYYYENSTAEAAIVANTAITINVGENKFETTTDNNGVFTITYQADTQGTYPITGELETDKVIKNSEASLTVNPETRVDLNIEDPVIGENVSLTANLTGIIGDSTGGKVIFRVNGKTLRDSEGNVIYVDVVNGTAKLPDVAVTGDWMKPDTEIQAIFSGNDEYDSFATEKTHVTVTKPEAVVTITSEAQAFVGKQATFTAKVTSGDALVNSGRVVFKLNGKTLKDENGKALYVNVVNGFATVNYTIPEKTKVKDYNLTAVFTDAAFDRCEASQQISIQKASG